MLTVRLSHIILSMCLLLLFIYIFICLFYTIGSKYGKGEKLIFIVIIIIIFLSLFFKFLKV